MLLMQSKAMPKKSTTRPSRHAFPQNQDKNGHIHNHNQISDLQPQPYSINSAVYTSFYQVAFGSW